MVGRGVVLTGLGVAVGLLGAWALIRALASILYGVAATDPVTFGGTTLLLGVVMWVPP